MIESNHGYYGSSKVVHKTVGCQECDGTGYVVDLEDVLPSIDRNEHEVDGPKDKVFECVVRDCMESWTHSIHKTRKGAYKSGNQWLQSMHNRSFDSRALIGKSTHDFMGKFHSYKIVTTDLLD